MTSWASLPGFLPRGRMAAPQTGTAAVGPFNTDTIVISQDITCTAGRAYEVTARFFACTGTVLGDRFTFQIKANGTTTTDGQQSVYIESATGTSSGALIIGTYQCAASGTVTFTLHGVRGAGGTGNVTVSGSSGTPITLYVKDIGDI